MNGILNFLIGGVLNSENKFSIHCLLFTAPLAPNLAFEASSLPRCWPFSQTAGQFFELGADYVALASLFQSILPSSS